MSEIEIEQGSELGKLASVLSVFKRCNAVGRRTAETREDGNSRNFNYDRVDRILASVSSAPSVVNSESFAYDQVGNWTINSRQHDGDNKLTSDASYNYAYDVEGNLIQKASKTNPADVTTYAYDAENKLVHVTVGSAVTATIAYQYDALGRRIARSLNGVTTRYVIDGNNIRLELNSGNQIIAANTESGLDQLLVRDTSAGSYFVHQDGLGSTTAITDNTGAVVERYRYSSFGQLSVLAPDSSLLSSAPKVPETYTGREWDSDAGIYFYRARFYSPVMGRFLSQDPLGYAAGINYYSYVGNDPLLLTDPMGLFLWTGLSAGEFFGAAGSGALHGAEAFSDGVTGAVGAHPFANNGFYDQNDPSLQISRKIGTATLVTEASIVGLSAGSGIIADAAAANEISAGTAVGYNAILGSGAGVVGNTANQLINNGGDLSNVSFGQQVLSGGLGAGFGTVSGLLGQVSNAATQNSTNTIANLTESGINAEVEGALLTQNGALPVNQAALNGTLNGIMSQIDQTAANASFVTNALETTDHLLPIGEQLADYALASQLGLESQNENGRAQSGTPCR
jgi:RHS repeat-associated protein